MTTTPAWHQDPYDGTRLRWHDGSAWTDFTAPTGPRRPALGAGWFRVATALQVSLAVVIAVDAVALAIDVWTARVMSGWIADPASVSESLGVTIDVVTLLATIAQVLTLVVTAVLFILWLFQAHSSDRMDPAYLRHKSGWAIGGWFVPILSLWRPRQMVQDVRRGALRESQPPGSALLELWWVGFLVNAVMTRAALQRLADPSMEGLAYVRALRTEVTVDAAAVVVDALVAVLAVLLVRRVTALVRDAQPV